MLVPDATFYPLLVSLVQILCGSLHQASLTAVTDALWALLLAQSLHPADLARALPQLRTRRSRQAFRRIRRLLQRHLLTSMALTPFLLQAALRLVRDQEVFLILDSTRCRRWELFTLGIALQGRVLPIAWAVLPYPWPSKQYTRTVVALLNRTLAAWPSDRPVHLLADRGFPSLKLFQALDHWRGQRPVGYTIRLRAGDYVRLASGETVKVLDLLQGVRMGHWDTYQASYQQRRKAGALALLVVGRGVPVYPAHQQGPADQARRVARALRRLARLHSKRQPQAPETDTVWVLLSTLAGGQEAVTAYGRRFTTEGTYRDVKTWDLEAVAAHADEASVLDALFGLAALGYFVQAAIGAAAGHARGEAWARQQQWSTADRLSIFWRGRQVLHDRAYDWRSWLQATLHVLLRDLQPTAVRAESSDRVSLPIAAKEAA
jgi:hypothetical protein